MVVYRGGVFIFIFIKKNYSCFIYIYNFFIYILSFTH
jgi:hypothetical protein